jgi:cytochrome c553
MLRSFLVLTIATLGWLALPAVAAPSFEDTMGQRTLACTACHGKLGRAAPDGYYPRLAGKPAGYLYNQLLNFRDGRRHYGLMTGLIEPLTDAYLMEIAQYFSKLALPYPAPEPAVASQPVLDRGRLLVTQGAATSKVPACTQCHGAALTGVAPNIPGLLGLPRDYLNAQLGAWQTGQRRAAAPDCMAHTAKRLSTADVSAVAHWLASQPLPAHAKPATTLPPLAAQSERIDCGSAPLPNAVTPAVAISIKPASASVAQGAYLARAGNCMGCHTERGAAPWAGGRGIETPFGTVFSSNLTSDTTTGIGSWSSHDFWQAMQHGRSRDGRLLNPAFPYTSFTHISRADSDALFAYLQTVPPSKQPNKVHALRWPFGTQAALTLWRALYFSPGVYASDAAQTAQWNRGAYLVRGLGHCGACHTPRNALGASNDKFNLAGGKIPMQNWYAPSLRLASEASVSDLRPEHIVALLKTGVSPSGSAAGPMAEVVRNSTQYLSDGDLRAMAVFLMSLSATAQTSRTAPASPGAERTRPSEAPGSARDHGAKLYETHCTQCHGDHGEGIKGAYSPLAGNRAVTTADPSNLVQTVLHGGYAPATAGNPHPFGMPPFVLQLNDKNTATVLTYIRNAWGNSASPVTELEVTQARSPQTR